MTVKNITRAPLFDSKKSRLALIGSLIALFGGLATGLAETGDLLSALIYVEWQLVITPWLLAIGAQGIADFGKEKAKIENGNK